METPLLTVIVPTVGRPSLARTVGTMTVNRGASITSSLRRDLDLHGPAEQLPAGGLHHPRGAGAA